MSDSQKNLEENSNIPSSSKENAKTLSNDLSSTREDHENLCAIFGLNKSLNERGRFEENARNVGAKPFVILAVSVAVIAGFAASWAAYGAYLQSREEALALATHADELAREQARKDRIEYADIAFLDSIPPLVAISMEGKPLYARSKDGAYTELRARESTWIQNLPIKEDTVLHFGFSAEGFMPLTRAVAYYDWFPTNRPDANPLQKAFKKIALVPDTTPRVEECSKLPQIGDSDPCEWSVFREIAFRERYAEAVKSATTDPSKQRALIVQNLTLHPGLRAAANISPEILASDKPLPAPDAGDAQKALLTHIQENPFGLYGTLTLETDTPETRVFFMSEPLMITKASGSMAQVQVQPDNPYSFSTYGAGRPLEITQNMTLRMEAPNAPPYVAEITPLQWHCTTPGIDAILAMIPPTIPEEIITPDYRQYICDYSLKISVRFAEIRALESSRPKEAQPPEKTN